MVILDPCNVKIGVRFTMGAQNNSTLPVLYDRIVSMNKCLNCDSETKNPKFCSLNCSAKAQDHKHLRKAPIHRICAECGNSFVVNSANQIYCSRSCSASASNRRNPKITRKESVCANCNKVHPARNYKYCSSECSVAYHKKLIITKWLETGKGTLGGYQNTLRQYLYSEQENKCNICHREAIWEGLELRLILDHIDGNSENNWRDNLRLICPNCDSLLPTYKAKNKGNGRHARRLRYANGLSS